MGMIYFDSCLLIYLVERHPTHERRVRQKLEEVTSSRFAISPLVKLECLVGAFRRADPVLERLYRKFFDRFVTLELSESTYLMAARLRAQFHLPTPDALHLACAGARLLGHLDERRSAASGRVRHGPRHSCPTACRARTSLA